MLCTHLISFSHDDILQGKHARMASKDGGMLLCATVLIFLFVMQLKLINLTQPEFMKFWNNENVIPKWVPIELYLVINMNL